MSRIGKKPIPIGSEIEVKIEDRDVSVKGPRGRLSWALAQGVDIAVENESIHVRRSGDSPALRALHGLTRAELQNIVNGVTKGYEKTLELTGVGYRAQLQGQVLTLNVGFAHPILLDIPSGVEASIEKQVAITIRGIDKRLVTQVAADIRQVRPPDVYKQKGIKYAGEALRKKAGKTGKK
ncbi:MAG: 50S ribosomal protein L6 [Nitrospirales bacterium]|nr:50S ribosomal protein L6 [Nitrospirales bacterium]